jgi:DNA-binding XRE family transcriptional regulator
MTAEGLIRRARQHVSLTQTQLARKLGVAKQSVADMEAKANPSPAVLARYGAAMGLELAIYYITPDGNSIE